MLCILTSTLFAGRNHIFDAKTTFSINLYHKMFKKPQKITIKHVKKGAFFYFFVYFAPLVTKNVVLASESLFRPANGLRSTRLLVEIHNKHTLGT